MILMNKHFLNIFHFILKTKIARLYVLRQSKERIHLFILTFHRQPIFWLHDFFLLSSTSDIKDTSKNLYQSREVLLGIWDIQPIIWARRFYYWYERYNQKFEQGGSTRDMRDSTKNLSKEVLLGIWEIQPKILARRFY